jgi:hypothetical protein
MAFLLPDGKIVATTKRFPAVNTLQACLNHVSLYAAFPRIYFGSFAVEVGS